MDLVTIPWLATRGFPAIICIFAGKALLFSKGKNPVYNEEKSKVITIFRMIMKLSANSFLLVKKNKAIYLIKYI